MQRILSNPLFLLTVLLFVVTESFFKGIDQQGISREEVARVTALFPYFIEGAGPNDQSIQDVSVFGVRIPLMFKNYVSYVWVLPFVPMFFCEDILLGLRLTYIFYYLLAIGFIYWGTSKFFPQRKYWPLTAAALFATSPLLFPDLRINYAAALHVPPSVLGAYYFWRWLSTDRRLHLFLGLLFLFFTANLAIYFLWTFAALVVCFLILDHVRFFATLKRLLKPANLAILALTFTIGYFNYIVYNLNSGFATFKPLYYLIFKPTAYGDYAIDYNRTSFYSAEFFTRKIKALRGLLNDGFGVWLASLGFIAATIFSVPYLKRFDRRAKTAILFFPVTFVATAFFVMISPNVQLAGHFAYLSPVYEVAVCVSVFFCMEALFKKHGTKAAYALLAIAIGIQFQASKTDLAPMEATGGKGLFSPANQEVYYYLVKKKIPADQVLLAAAMAENFYFLSRGRYEPKNIFNRVANVTYSDKPMTESQKKATLKDVVLDIGVEPNKIYYFPAYNVSGATMKEKTTDPLLDLFREKGIKIDVEKEFLERDHSPAITIYRFENLNPLFRAR